MKRRFKKPFAKGHAEELASEEWAGSLRRIGALFLVGFLLICSLGLGIVYSQQTMKQRTLREQITKLSLAVSQPPASIDRLKREYDEVISSIPLPEPLTIVEKIVITARESGLDIEPENDKFRIPHQNAVKDERLGDITYQVITFSDVRVRGDYASVMNFISNLESGVYLKTAVVNIAQVSAVTAPGEERPEYLAVLTIDVYTRRKG